MNPVAFFIGIKGERIIDCVLEVFLPHELGWLRIPGAFSRKIKSEVIFKTLQFGASGSSSMVNLEISEVNGY